MHLVKDRDAPLLDLRESRSNAGLYQERPPVAAADFFVARRRIMADMILSFVTISGTAAIEIKDRERCRMNLGLFGRKETRGGERRETLEKNVRHLHVITNTNDTSNTL